MSCCALLGDGDVGKDDPLARCSEECALGCGRTTTLRPFDTWINAQIVFWVTSMHRVFGFGGGTAAAAELPVHVVRYEELRHNTTAVLAQLLPFLGTYPTRRGSVVVTVDWGPVCPISPPLRVRSESGVWDRQLAKRRPHVCRGHHLAVLPVYNCVCNHRRGRVVCELCAHRR